MILSLYRTFLRTTAFALVIAGLCVATPACVTNPRLKDPASAGRPIPAYPVWSKGTYPALRSVESRSATDGSGTIVTLRGDQPMAYSVDSSKADSWALQLDGMDPRGLDKDMAVGTPELERIQIGSVLGASGHPAARISFEGGESGERRVTSDGNNLIVTMTSLRKMEPDPQMVDPAVSPAPASVPVAVPVAPSPAPVSEASAGQPGPVPPGIQVAAGKSITFDLDSPVSRISVANPAVADAVVISPQQLLINGVSPGNTSLVVWKKSGEVRNYNLSVLMDIEALALNLKEFFPQEKIGVGSSKETLVLYGTVSKPDIGDRAARIASDYSTKVVNNLTYPPSGRRQIMLKVVFAEVNRQAITELSASLVRVDPNNLRGDHEGMTSLGSPGALGNVINNPVGPDFNFNDAINIYAFNFRDKIAGFITAMKTRGLLQVLAEPTLIAADGQKASFLAGGEFPIPVVQAGAGTSSVTIIFKKFGIGLDFQPEIREDGTIVLKVEPEVSSLDFANAVILGGFRVPALKVRRAATEIELKDGQSFAIAGLYSSDLQQTKKKIPLLGDIPLLGALFRSKNLNKNKTELMVIATPVLVEPLAQGAKPALPDFDMSFDLDKKGAQEKHTDDGAHR